MQPQVYTVAVMTRQVASYAAYAASCMRCIQYIVTYTESSTPQQKTPLSSETSSLVVPRLHSTGNTQLPYLMCFN